MNKTLHIVNGDSTAQILDKTTIQGDVVVWREMLCEGPLHKEIGSDKFWSVRNAYFENEFGISKIEYYDKTIKEILKIDEIANYNEVILWFEFDLFCQINLLGLCTYLFNSYRKDIQYSLICSGKEKGKTNLQHLSDYGPENIENLLETKVNISRNNFLYAQECWNTIAKNDPKDIVAFDFNKSAKFPYLKMAILQHLQRLPAKNGLNQIDNKILSFINLGGLTEKKIIREILSWQHKETIYGFGDFQYFHTLKKLKKYYTVENELFILNEQGKYILK